MSNEFGTYAFTSWLRRGVSTGIVRKDGDSRATTDGDFVRATISVKVAVSGAPAGAPVEVTGLALYGPGEVSGFDPRAVVRTWPKPDVFDVEDNYFPLIEFGQPDLPWRYTPASPDADRLRPWFCLIALKDDEYDLHTGDVSGQDRPLQVQVLKVKTKTPLPKLSQAWAWAHVQVSGEKILDPATDLNKVRKLLTDEPQRVVARLLCPRRLDPQTAYTVFVVPTFERGRLAGLGRKVEKTVDALETSWTDKEATLDPNPRARVIELPVYYSWRFQTGLGGDFEYLVSLLKKEPLPDTVGKRDMDVQDPGAGLPKASVAPMGLEGALKAPNVESKWGETEPDKTIRNIWRARLTGLLNRPTALLTRNTEVRVLSGASGVQEFIFESATALPETDDSFAFALADWDRDGKPDLIAIKQRMTSTSQVEIEILSGASAFQQPIFRINTVLPATGDYAFAFADWDGDGIADLIAIKQTEPGTNSFEVYILSGDTKFKKILLKVNMPLEGVHDTFAFAVADWDGDGRPDLIAIKKRKTNTNSVEVYVLSGASKFQEVIFEGDTPLEEANEMYAFVVADWDGDGTADLIATKQSNTHANNCEVHVLSGASKFRKFLLQTEISLEEGHAMYAFGAADWDGDGKPDLIAIKKRCSDMTGTAKRVALPLYGRWHAAQETVVPDDPKATPPWFHELNIDPRLRVAASLGTHVIQSQQQQLMAGAWRQVEGIRKINAELRQAQLAREVATRVYERHIAVKDDESVLHVTVPVQGRVRHTEGTTKTVKAWLRDSPITEGIFEAQWRRVARPLGPLGRRQGRAGMPRKSNLLDRLNGGILSPADPPPTPSRMSTFAGAGLDVDKLALDIWPFPGPADKPRDYNPDERDYKFEKPLGNIDPTKIGTGIGWDVFGQAAKELFTQLKRPPKPAAKRHKIDIAKLKETLVKELDPQRTIESSYTNRLTESKLGATWRQGNDALGQVMAAPEFPQPMFEPLRDLSQDWLLPGLDKVAPNTMSLLKTNELFVEAYMVGLNHEMARELLWNGYPTDQRGSYFRQFWDASSYLKPNGTLPDPKSLTDIGEIHHWEKTLGENNNPQNPGSGDKLVLLVRGELLRRYPNALLYATKAEWVGTGNNRRRDLKYKKLPNGKVTSEIDPSDEKHPIFSGTLKPDVSFFKFDLTQTEAEGDANEGGWFFLLQEQPSDIRFGLDAANKDNTGHDINKDSTSQKPSTWKDLSWGHLANDTAQSEEQVPAKIAGITYINLKEPNGRPKIDPSKPFDADGLHWLAEDSHAADIARITLQAPVRVAVHASDMLPE